VNENQGFLNSIWSDAESESCILVISWAQSPQLHKALLKKKCTDCKVFDSVDSVECYFNNDNILLRSLTESEENNSSSEMLFDEMNDATLTDLVKGVSEVSNSCSVHIWNDTSPQTYFKQKLNQTLWFVQSAQWPHDKCKNLVTLNVSSVKLTFSSLITRSSFMLTENAQKISSSYQKWCSHIHLEFGSTHEFSFNLYWVDSKYKRAILTTSTISKVRLQRQEFTLKILFTVLDDRYLSNILKNDSVLNFKKLLPSQGNNILNIICLLSHKIERNSGRIQIWKFLHFSVL